MEVNTDKLEKFRKKQYLSIKEFAKKLGVTRQCYYDILKSKSTTLNRLNSIAGILNCKPKDLLI